MSSGPTIPLLTGTIAVDAPIERAFRVFTENLSSWWPADYTSARSMWPLPSWNRVRVAAGTSTLLTAASAGSGAGLGATAPAGRDLADHGQWQYEPGPTHASEIEVHITASGPDQTTIELEHRHLERLVDGQALRDRITGEVAGLAAWSCSPRPPPGGPDPVSVDSLRSGTSPGRTRARLVRSGARGGVADADGPDLAGVDGGLLFGLAGIGQVGKEVRRVGGVLAGEPRLQPA